MLFKVRGMHAPREERPKNRMTIADILAFRDTWKEVPYKGFSVDAILHRARVEKQRKAEIPKLVMSENGFHVRDKEKMDAAELELRRVQGTLNKLTEYNFDAVMVEMLSPQLIFDPTVLSGAVNIIFTKAVAEPVFSGLYARLCARIANYEKELIDEAAQQPGSALARTVQEVKDNLKLLSPEERARIGNVGDFVRVALVLRCQAFHEQFVQQSHPKDEESEERLRKQNMANIKFVAELYMKSLVTNKVIVFICSSALSLDMSPKTGKPAVSDVDVEMVINLINVLGKKFDETGSNAVSRDKIWDALKRCVDDKRLSMRIRFLLQNLLDWRSSGWKPKEGTAPAPPTSSSSANEASTMASTPGGAAVPSVLAGGAADGLPGPASGTAHHVGGPIGGHSAPFVAATGALPPGGAHHTVHTTVPGVGPRHGGGEFAGHGMVGGGATGAPRRLPDRASSYNDLGNRDGHRPLASAGFAGGGAAAMHGSSSSSALYPAARNTGPLAQSASAAPPPLPTTPGDLPEEERKFIALAQIPQALTSTVEAKLLSIVRDATVEEDWSDMDKQILDALPGEAPHVARMCAVYVVAKRITETNNEADRKAFVRVLNSGVFDASALLRGYAWCLTQAVANGLNEDYPLLFKRFVALLAATPTLTFTAVLRDVLVRSANYLDALSHVMEADNVGWAQGLLEVSTGVASLWNEARAGEKEAPGELLQAMATVKQRPFMRYIAPDFVMEVLQLRSVDEDSIRAWLAANRERNSVKLFVEQLEQLFPECRPASASGEQQM